MPDLADADLTPAERELWQLVSAHSRNPWATLDAIRNQLPAILGELVALRADYQARVKRNGS